VHNLFHNCDLAFVRNTFLIVPVTINSHSFANLYAHPDWRTLIGSCGRVWFYIGLPLAGVAAAAAEELTFPAAAAKRTEMKNEKQEIRAEQMLPKLRDSVKMIARRLAVA
jgi:hypothetical protein